MTSSRDFDPRTRAFSDEELKPQPMIKKSRKQFVPDEMKDDKYWARRRKNNMAAKRSRDARRMKENQIALRAGYLEKEVTFLESFCMSFGSNSYLNLVGCPDFLPKKDKPILSGMKWREHLDSLTFHSNILYQQRKLCETTQFDILIEKNALK